MKVVVVGTGYVGLSNAVLLSQNHEVIAIDISSARVTQLNNKISPILDDEVQDFLENKQLNFLATSSKKQAFENADYVIIATPTERTFQTPINKVLKSSSKINHMKLDKKDFSINEISVNDIVKMAKHLLQISL